MPEYDDGGPQVESQSTSGKKKAEDIRRASIVLGVDASRLPPKILENILAEIAEDSDDDSGPLVDEGGSAPAILQSAKYMVLGSGHQPHTAAVTISAPLGNVQQQAQANDDTATESESEPEFIELGPGDSVSQQPPFGSLALRPPTPLPNPRTLVPATSASNKKTLSTTSHSTPGSTVSNLKAPKPNSELEPEPKPEPEPDPEPQTQRASKRPRLEPPSRTTFRSRIPRLSVPRPGRLSSRPLPAVLADSVSQPLHSTPFQPVARRANLVTSRTPPPVHTPSSLRSLNLDPPPTSDIGAALTWAAQLATQVTRDVGTSNHAADASRPAYDLLAQVLSDVFGRLPTSTPRVQAHTQHLARYRRRSDFVDDNAEMLEAEAGLALGERTKRPRKPTLADFTGFRREIASLVIPEFIVTACCQGLYETFGVFDDMVIETWERLWNRELPDEPLEKAPRSLRSIIVHRASTFRGDMKERVRPRIPFLFPLVNPPRTADDLELNKRLVKRILRPGAMHCRDLKSGVNEYEHVALKECIAASYFWGPESIGATHHDHMSPVPLPAVAGTLTTMQHCINEWATGRYVPLVLHADTQAKMYRTHLDNLRKFGQTTSRNRLDDLREEWFEYGIAYAGGSINVDDDDE